MKKLLLYFFMLVTVQVFCQKPLRLDSTKLINNQLFDYYGSVAVPRGQVIIPTNPPGTGLALDAGGNLLIGNEIEKCEGCLKNFVFADAVQLITDVKNTSFGTTTTRSHNNIVTAIHAKIIGSSGATVTGADHTVYLSPYATVLGDGNFAYKAESVFISGATNISSNPHGTVLGLNNIQGSYSSDTATMTGNYFGGVMLGVALKTKGSFVNAIGYNFSTDVFGTHIGNNKVQFSVVPNQIIVNSDFVLTQQTPTSLRVGQIAVDDNYLYVGTNSGMKWVALQSGTPSRLTQEEKPKATAVFNPYTGQYNIIKPIK